MIQPIRPDVGGQRLSSGRDPGVLKEATGVAIVVVLITP
jgi:hypothetical protein